MHWKEFVLAGLLAAALAACSNGPEWSGDPQLARKLTMKMPEAEVRKLLGEPSTVRSMEVAGIKTDTWIYNSKEPVQLIVQDGKLIVAYIGTEKLFEATVADL